MMLNKKYVVYLHIFPNGKHYVGITCANPHMRRWRAGSSYSCQPKIFNAIKKYGWENIDHKILEKGLTLERANAMEIYYIEIYDSVKSGYNVSTGGGGTMGIKCSDETKRKIGVANKGNPCVNRDNFKKYLDEHGVWNKGCKLSGEHLRKITIERQIRCNKAIYALDVLTKEIVMEFESATKAAIHVGVTKNGICRCCKGGRPTSGGYVWRYKDDYIEQNKNRKNR